jgi:hypothetical protein
MIVAYDRAPWAMWSGKVAGYVTALIFFYTRCPLEGWGDKKEENTKKIEKKMTGLFRSRLINMGTRL